MADVREMRISFMKRNSNLGLRRYQKFFDFKIEDIKGKKILDVGAAKAQFQHDAENVGAQVVSLDPAYSHASGLESLPYKKGKIAAKVQAIPFQEKVFDIVLGRRVVPDRVSGKDRYIAISEMLRVTKRGGWIAIGPFNLSNGLAGLRTIRNLLRRSSFPFSEYKIKAKLPSRKYVLQTYLKVNNTGDFEKLTNLIKFIN